MPFQIELLSSSKIFSQTLTFQHNPGHWYTLPCPQMIDCLWQWRAFLNPINTLMIPTYLRTRCFKCKCMLGNSIHVCFFFLLISLSCKCPGQMLITKQTCLILRHCMFSIILVLLLMYLFFVCLVAKLCSILL